MPANEELVRLLTSSQNWLYAYIISLLGDPGRADDVLQNTNLAIWKKAEEFTLGTSFDAWASKIAYFQVLAARRDLGRERLLFDDALLEQIAEQARLRAEDEPIRYRALRSCLEKLPGQHRALVGERYASEGTGLSIQELADQHGETPAAIVSSLYRIRKTLLDCIRRTIAKEDDQ